MARGTNEIDAVREDLAQLREDLGKLMSKVGELSGDAAADTTHRISRTAQDLTETAVKSYDRLAHEAQRYTTTVERSIAEHPFGAAAIALAAGLVISRFFDRPNGRR